jgi:hypothetical protein
VDVHDPRIAHRDVRAVVLRGVLIVGVAAVLSAAIGYSLRSASILVVVVLAVYIAATIGRGYLVRRRLGQLHVVASDEPAWNCAFVDGPWQGVHARIAAAAMERAMLVVPLLIMAGPAPSGMRWNHKLRVVFRQAFTIVRSESTDPRARVRRSCRNPAVAERIRVPLPANWGLHAAAREAFT